MINTDEYEGHLADALICVREGGVECDFSKISIEDALDDMADLLAEVKRLREQFKLAYDWVDYQFPDGGMQDFAKYIGDEEE